METWLICRVSITWLILMSVTIRCTPTHIKLWTKSLLSKTKSPRRSTRWTRCSTSRVHQKCSPTTCHWTTCRCSSNRSTWVCRTITLSQWNSSLKDTTKESRSSNSKMKWKSKIQTWIITWRQARTCDLERRWTTSTSGRINKCNILSKILTSLLRIQVQTVRKKVLMTSLILSTHKTKEKLNWITSKPKSVA